MKKKQKHTKPKSLMIGLFLLVWGLYLLAKTYGLVSESFPFWPIILVLAGIYFLTCKKD